MIVYSQSQLFLSSKLKRCPFWENKVILFADEILTLSLLHDHEVGDVLVVNVQADILEYICTVYILLSSSKNLVTRAKAQLE